MFVFRDSRQRIDRERIFLWGDSYGALLVADAVVRDPSAVRGVVLLSMIPSGSRGSAHRGAPRQILAFHGANDVVQSPQKAREEILDLFGRGALSGRSRWMVFQREGHSFRRLETWASVYAQLIAALDDPFEP